MRSLIYTSVLIFSGLQAGAETVTLRSAEHSAFTRLVFDTVAPQKVRVSRSEKTIEVRFPKVVNKIDASGVFRRITRDKISDVVLRQNENLVQFKLSCDCQFRSSVEGKTMFVLDVLTASETTPDPSENVTPDTALVKFSQRDRPKLSFKRSEAYEKPELPVEQSSGEAARSVSSTQQPHQSPKILRNRLLDALSSPPANSIKGTAVRTEGMANSNPPVQMVFHSVPLSQNRAQPELEASSLHLQRDCAELSLLDPRNWEDSETAIDALQKRRWDVLSDSASDAQIRKLALTYLSLAMGAEAQSLLAQIAQVTEVDQHLRTLAFSVDGGEIPENWPVFQMIACEELQAWQGFRDRDLSSDQARTIKSHFSSWPSALQAAFADRLAGKFLESGHKNDAGYTLRIVENEASVSSGDRSIVKSQLLEASGENKEAEQILKTALNADNDAAPQAAIALASRAMANNTNPNAAVDAALEAYSEELSGTQQEIPLLKTRVKSAARAKDFDTAFEFFAALPKDVSSQEKDMILDWIAAEIISLESDGTFLREAVSVDPLLFRRFSGTLRQKIKTRISSLGFTDLASQLGIALQGETARFQSEVEADFVPQTGANSNLGESDGDLAAESRERPNQGQIKIAEATREQVKKPVMPTRREAAINKTQTLLGDTEALLSQLAELGIAPSAE